MTVAALRALHAVIGGAIDEIEREYQSQSKAIGLPLDYPSLDVPYYTSKTNPPEIVTSEALTTEPIIFGASNKIVAACGQLMATVHRPFFSMVERAQAGSIIACMRFLEATHVVEILREAGPSGLHVKDIASRSTELLRAKDPKAAQIDPANMCHVLRLLATDHWTREIKPDIFANNRLSSSIDSGKSTESLNSSPENKYDETNGVGAYLGLSVDELAKIQTTTCDWLLGGGSNSGYRAPFNLAFETDRKYFEWLEEPGNEYRLARFGKGMNGLRYWEVTDNIVNGFPWQDLPKDSVVVDVGGGIGSVSVVLAEAYPHLRFIVEDRAPVIAIAPQSWGSKHTELFSSGRVVFRAQDFFEPHQPFTVPTGATVSQPDVFLLRTITHNWPDEDVQKILTLLRQAAGSHTKLLLVDNLLPYACVDEAGKTAGESEGAVRSLVPDDSPLIPNLGRASLNGYILDISMIAMFNGKERTYREMDTLMQSAGWKISRVKRAVGSLWAYIAAEPINIKPQKVQKEYVSIGENKARI